MPSRPTPTRVLRAAGCLLVLAAAGCTSDPGTGGPDASSAEPAPAAFDCEAVARAEEALDERGAAELERLGLVAGDPQALTVTLVAASTGAPAYWAAFQDALTQDAPATVVADVGTVRDDWAALEPELSTITLADAEPATVQAAGDRLAAVAGAAPDDALAPAQDRVEDALRTTCG